MTTYKVLEAFDFAPRNGVVLTFKKGQICKNMTRATIEKGKALGAIEIVKTKEDKDGTADNL